MDPSVRKLSARQWRARLATDDLDVDEDLTRMARTLVYRSRDGEVLLLLPPDNREGLQFASDEDLRDWIRRHEMPGRGGPMSAAEILVLDQSFVARVPELVSKLPGVLELEKHKVSLDYSVLSVQSIDRILRQWMYSRRLDPDVVLPLWAYIGEVIRRQTDGRWQIMPSAPGESPEPMIANRSGKRAVGVGGFHKELLEEFDEGGSLAARVIEAIDYLGPAAPP